MHLGELLDHGCAVAGEGSPALTDGPNALTWAGYRDRAARLAGRLSGAGVRPGDRVVVHLPKSVESFVTAHAILRAGAVMVPLDWFGPVGHLRSVIDDADAVALVTRAAPAAVEEMTAGASVALVTTPDDVDGPSPEAVPVRRGDPAYVIYTSGSTGRPKGIVHTHASACAYAELAVTTYGLTTSDRLANIAPLQFDQSTFELYAAPLAGASVLVVPDPVMRFPATLADLIAAQKITVWYSVPYALRQLAERGALDRHDLSTLRWILYGGEVYPPDELATLMRAIPSARVSNVYGPAEVNQCTFHHLDAPPPGSAPVPIGRAWRGARVALLDDGQVVDGPGCGEAWVATDTMMDCYWNRPDLTAASIAENPTDLGAGRWYRTGDLLERRADGELVFLGRLDNQVKLRGYRIELEAVEAAVVDSGPVGGCAAVVDEDGESILAIVDPALDDAALDVVRKAAGRRLPRHALPARIVAVDHLPRTATGKVDRSAARRMVSGGGDSARTE